MSNRVAACRHFERYCARGKAQWKFEPFWRIFITVAVAGTDMVVCGVAVIAMIA